MFARIPRGRIPWLPNNVSVGRGASRWASDKAHPTTSPESSQAHQLDANPTPRPTGWQGPRIFNPLYSGSRVLRLTDRAETPTEEGDETVRGRRNTSEPNNSVPQADTGDLDEWERPGRIASRLSLLERSEEDREASRDVSAQSREGNGNTLWAQEPLAPMSNNSGWRGARERTWEEVYHRRLDFSDQVHILGLDLAGRYIGHALAGCETIPRTHYLLHDPFLKKAWHKSGACLTLHRDDVAIVRHRVVGEYIRVRTTHESRDINWYVSDKLIRNLIITVPAGHVLRALDPIVHRLDHRSTICFLQDALGVMEDVAEAYFPDESSRPVFLVGHFTSTLGHVHPFNENLFAVRELRRERLHLSIPTVRGGAIPGSLIKHHPPHEQTLRHTHLIRLLTAVPELSASGNRYADTLSQKIFRVAFRSVAEPLATMMDSPYAGLEQNTFATQIMDRAIGEICDVIARLPEFRDIDSFRRAYLAPLMRKEMFGRLKAKAKSDSKMRTFTARAWVTDVDYLTGYFVRKGRELAVRVDTLEMLLLLVKGKRETALKRLESAIPIAG